MKLNILALSCLLSFSGASFAQSASPSPAKPVTSSVSQNNFYVKKAPACQNQSFALNDEQARDISTAVFVNNILLLQHFLSSYCVDGNSYSKTSEPNPMYLVRTDEALRYLLSAGFNPLNKLSEDTKLDMLSFFLIEHVSNQKFVAEKGSQDIKPKLAELEAKLKIPGLSKSVVSPLTVSERNKIIKTLLEEYKRTDFYHRDALNNNVSTYAILTIEPESFGKSLTLSPNIALLQKNKDNLSLVHIAMLPKHPVGTPEENKLKLQAINNFILANINEKNIGMIRYEDLNIIDFASLLQANNPELYQGLVTKFPSVKPTRFNAMTEDEKNKARTFFNQFDYIEKLKEALFL